MRTKSQQQKKQVQSNVVSAVATPALAALAPGAARHLPKPHTGFENFVNPLAGLAGKYKTEIGTHGIDIEEMKSALAQYQALADAHDAAVAQLAAVDGTRLQLASKVWAYELAVYGQARFAARKNPDIALALKEFEQFMKQGPRKKSTPTPTGSSGTGGGTPTS